MAISRRDVLLGSAGAAGAAAFSFPVPAIAQSEPISLGWLAAMTGPSSAPAIGFNRGVTFAAEAINAAGGVKGRKIEILTRDTQGDPTKAVNATQEMISQAQGARRLGPDQFRRVAGDDADHGARQDAEHPPLRCRQPDRHRPISERLPHRAVQHASGTTLSRNYCLNILKVKKVAVIGDTTGYGVAAVNASVAGFKKDGAEVVYQANIDATQPDMTPDMLRARNAGAEVIVVWSVSTGMEARMFNTRAAMGWDVPVRRPPLDVIGRDRRPRRKAGELGKSLCHRLPQLQLRCSRQTAAAQQELVDKLKGNVDLLATRCCGGSPAASTR